MSVAPVFPEPRRGAPAAGGGAASGRARPERRALDALPDEAAWWSAAPLVDGARDLRALPAGALERLSEHYLPFALRVLRRHASSLATLVGDSDEIAAQAALWLVEAMRAYDPVRGAPFAAYLVEKLPKRVMDLSRSCGSGRFVADSELGYSRARERSLRDYGREPTAAELAAEFGEDPGAVAERIRVVQTRRALRRPADVGSVDVAALSVSAHGAVWATRPGAPGDDEGADTRLLAAAEQQAVTVALVAAARHGDGIPGGTANVRGFFTLWLETFAGYCRSDLARAGRTGPKTIAAAQRALLSGVRVRLAAD